MFTIEKVPETTTTTDVIFECGAGLRWNLSAGPLAAEGLRVVFAGQSGSGKTHAAAVVAEECAVNNVPALVIDADDRFYGLSELANARVFSTDPDKADYLIDIDGLARWVPVAVGLVEAGGIAVCDIQGFTNMSDKQLVYTLLCETLFKVQGQRRKQGALYPCLLIVDECHEFCHVHQSHHAPSVLISEQLFRKGRGNGIHLVFLSQRPADLRRVITGQANVKLYGRVKDHADLKVMREYIPRGLVAKLKGLKQGDLIADYDGKFSMVRFRERTTTDYGQTPVITRRSVPKLDLSDIANKAIAVQRSMFDRD